MCFWNVWLTHLERRNNLGHVCQNDSRCGWQECSSSQTDQSAASTHFHHVLQAIVRQSQCRSKEMRSRDKLKRKVAVVEVSMSRCPSMAAKRSVTITKQQDQDDGVDE